MSKDIGRTISNAEVRNKREMIRLLKAGIDSAKLARDHKRVAKYEAKLNAIRGYKDA